MVATPEMVPTDMVLELGDDLSPGAFMDAARAFFGLVAEISKTVTGDTEHPVDWVVKVRESSALLGVEPAVGASQPVVRRVYQKFAASWERLEQGDLDNAGLSETGVRHARALSDLVVGRQHSPTPVRLWIEKRPIQVTAAPSNKIREFLQIDYHDYGTVEGVLDAIRDARGKLEITVFDAAMRQRVKCYVPEDLLEEAFEHFRNRVDVHGLIHYRKDGTPISIEVDRFERFPNPDDLPTANDVRGIMRATA